MCKAMNRSFTNVLFGAFGQVQASAAGAAEKRTVRTGTAEEAAQIMETAQSVIIIPGYGMAVAQAQHKVRELYDHLTCANTCPEKMIQKLGPGKRYHINMSNCSRCALYVQECPCGAMTMTPDTAGKDR